MSTNKLIKPDAILANDCIEQLKSLGVLDKKSEKRIRKSIENSVMNQSINNEVKRTNGFINELFRRDRLPESEQNYDIPPEVNEHNKKSLKHSTGCGGPEHVVYESFQ